MTDTPKQDLSALFPAPPPLDLPAEHDHMQYYYAREVEIRNIPKGMDATMMLVNLCAAFKEANDYAHPSGYTYDEKDKEGASAVCVRMREHMHYPSMFNAIIEVLESEMFRTNVMPDADLRIETQDGIYKNRPDMPPSSGNRYSGPRFMGH